MSFMLLGILNSQAAGGGGAAYGERRDSQAPAPSGRVMQL